METELFPFDVAPHFIGEFVATFQKYTEAPDEFLAMVPLFVGGVLAGRWIQFNGQHFNNYFLIIGPTGVAKKSTAQSLAMKLLQGVKKLNPSLQYEHSKSNGDDDQKEPLGPTSAYPLLTHFSIEGLQSYAIGNGTSTAVQMGEYGTLFEVGKRQSQQNTISELTNMYDGQLIDVKTISRQVTAEHFSLSVLAASTPAWLTDFCSGKNIGGGFVNRHLIIAGIPSRILPVQELPIDSHWNSLVHQYSQLIPSGIHPVIQGGRIQWSGHKQTFTWGLGAQEAWSTYYRARTTDMRQVTNPLLPEIAARELTHAAKLAGLAAFLDRRNAVSVKDLEFGVRLARWSTRNAIQLITGSSQSSVFGAVAEQVLQKLRKSGPMSKRDLAQYFGGNQKQVNRSISHLIVDEVIQDCPDGFLRICDTGSNIQLSEIQKYFGKINTCEFFKKSMLGVG